MIWECVIVGGGPAGLNAALVLGRSRRRVILFDDNKPRNAVTNESHGFITRDGISPPEFRKIAHADIQKYPSVQIIQEKIVLAEKENESLVKLTSENNQIYYTRKIILATGLKEVLTGVKGLEEFYGKSLFSCPYCDGWEMRDKPLVLITESVKAFYMAKTLYNWSKDLVVCTNGKRVISPEQMDYLQRKGIQVNEKVIAKLVGEAGMLEKLIFIDGTELMREGGFINPEWMQASNLGDLLGCELDKAGGILTDRLGRTSVSHVYAAGDTSFIAPSQMIIAASEGSRAAIAVNMDLTHEEN